MKRCGRKMGRKSVGQALTEDAACRGSRPHPLSLWGCPAHGSLGFCPLQQPCLRHRAELPVEPPRCTPPWRWCCHHTCSRALSGAGWHGPAAGPGSHWGRRRQSVVSDAPRGPDGLPLQSLAPSSEAVLGDLDFQGLGVKATVWRDGSIFKLNSGTSTSHWPTWTEHKETAPCATLPRQGAHCCCQTDTQKEIHWPWFHFIWK